MAEMLHATVGETNSLHLQAVLAIVGYKSKDFDKTVPSSILTKKISEKMQSNNPKNACK
jgi:hypothetical protein